MTDQLENVTAKNAIRSAIIKVAEFYQDQAIENMLLEGIEAKDGKWIVTVGFDIKKDNVRLKGPDILGAAIQHQFAPKEKLSHEKRTVELSEQDGSFIRMYS